MNLIDGIFINKKKISKRLFIRIYICWQMAQNDGETKDSLDNHRV